MRCLHIALWWLIAFAVALFVALSIVSINPREDD